MNTRLNEFDKDWERKIAKLKKMIEKASRSVAIYSRKPIPRFILHVPGLSVTLRNRWLPSKRHIRKSDGHNFFSFGMLLLSVMVDWRGKPDSPEEQAAAKAKAEARLANLKTLLGE